MRTMTKSQSHLWKARMKSPPSLSVLQEPLGCLSLSVRTANALDTAGVQTVQQLLSSCPRRACDCKPHDCPCAGGAANFAPFCFLLDIPNFGEKTLEEVFLALEEVGFVRGNRQAAVAQQQTEAEQKERFQRNNQSRRRLPKF
jgi:DNA-directed RNA polymerase alpha subunit